MANQSLDDYFAGPAMTKLMDSELIKRGIPFFLDPALQMPSMQKPIGINAQYDAYNGVREAGKITNYNSPAVNVEVTGSQKQFITCLGGKESFIIPDELVQSIKSNIPYVGQNAMREFLRRMKNFRERADTRRVNAISSAFLTGAIWIQPGSATGGVITTSSAPGAFNALAPYYAPTVINQGATLPNSTTVVPDFNLSTTDIPEFFRALHQAFLLTSNYEASQIAYGKQVPSYLGVQNTAMQAYWSRNQRYGGEFQDTNEVPKGALDFTWRAAYKQYFVDQANANKATVWLGDSQIVVTPAVDDGWWEMVEGSTKAPIGGIPVVSAADIDTMLAMFEYKWGINSFSMFQPDGTFSLSTIMQDFFIPLPKNPLVQWIINLH